MDDLRIPGISRGNLVTIVINGREFKAHEGESVHAALLAAGFRVLRSSDKSGEPRGLFCGMGICYDCLVTINGIPGQRACMASVTNRMEIIVHED